MASVEYVYATGITQVRYKHTDALGSPVVTTDASGNQVGPYVVYEPYGKAANTTIDGIGYTGHVMDPQSDLVYMQQRYYDPVVGRFLSVDPVSANAGNGAMFNRYSYALNNPYGFKDPDGRLARGIGRFNDPSRNSPLVSEEDACRRVCLENNADSASQAESDSSGSVLKRILDTPSPLPLSGDIFTVADIDLVGLTGMEISIGQVLDLDHPLESGYYISFSNSTSASVGAAMGIGYVRREIEGKGASLDFNLKSISVTSLHDEQGFNGASVTFGPGGGAAASYGQTWAISPRSVIEWMFEDE